MLPLLRETGEALHGPQWQSALARDLGISDRTMRRWVAGTYPVPEGVRDDLLRLCAERGALLEEGAQRLKAA